MPTATAPRSAGRMSVSLTLAAVQARTKTVTRRHVSSWVKLKAGDRLTLIEKGMGLKKGEKQVVVTVVEITDVRVEPLSEVTEAECAAEGFPEMRPDEFVEFWLRSHKYDPLRHTPSAVMVRRIEWSYLDTVTWHEHADLMAEFPRPASQGPGCGHHEHNGMPRHYHYVGGDRIDWRDEHGVDHAIIRPGGYRHG